MINHVDFLKWEGTSDRYISDRSILASYIPLSWPERPYRSPLCPHASCDLLSRIRRSLGATGVYVNMGHINELHTPDRGGRSEGGQMRSGGDHGQDLGGEVYMGLRCLNTRWIRLGTTRSNRLGSASYATYTNDKRAPAGGGGSLQAAEKTERRTRR